MSAEALIIGLNQDLAGRSPPLARAEADAEAIMRRLHTLMLDMKRVFPSHRCTLLRGAAAHSRTIGLTLAGAPHDVLLLYFSGTMRVDPARPEDPIALLTYAGDPAHDLSLRQLIDSCAARALVLLLDVLVIGGASASRAAAALTALTPSADALPGGYSLVVACSDSPEIKEPPGCLQGAFTATLLRGLTDSAALDQLTGEQTVGRLARYARAHLLEVTDRPPLLRHVGRDEGPLLQRRLTSPQRDQLLAARQATERQGSQLRCVGCGLQYRLDQLYMCGHCGNLYCSSCVGPISNAAGRTFRCACGGRVA